MSRTHFKTRSEVASKTSYKKKPSKVDSQEGLLKIIVTLSVLSENHLLLPLLIYKANRLVQICLAITHGIHHQCVDHYASEIGFPGWVHCLPHKVQHILKLSSANLKAQFSVCLKKRHFVLNILFCTPLIRQAFEFDLEFWICLAPQARWHQSGDLRSGARD
jgi:hypothetical protein